MQQSTNLSQNLWKRYGFCANPFDTSPLSVDHPVLPISEAIVGRGLEAREAKLLTNILRSPGGARIIVEGSIGVGKTTFVNYHRYLWETHSEDKLFTTQSEIAVTEDWRLNHFLVNILAALIKKLLCIKKEHEILKNSVFKEVFSLTKVLFQGSLNLEGSVFGFGGGFAKSEQVHIPILPEIQLLYYFQDMVKEIKKIGYAGILLHFDNIELFHKQNTNKAKLFFEEIRDAIQTADVYFIFVGEKGFFQQIISPLQRVRSIFFGRPILVPPLSMEQVLTAIHRRYQLLAINGNKIIKPVEDEFIGYLYNLYNGKLRYIMDAISMILPEFNYPQPEIISNQDAQKCLCYLIKEQVSANLSATEWQVFLYCIQLDDFTNKMLCENFTMPKTNIARIIRRFLELDLAYLDRKNGRYSFYKATDYTKVITTPKSTQSNKKSKKLPRSLRLKKAVEFIQENTKTSHSDYTKHMNISPATATLDLRELVKQNYIQKIGRGRNSYYITVNVPIKTQKSKKI